MKRQGIVAVVVIVALVAVVGLLARRGGGHRDVAPIPGDTRVFVSDTLGIRLQLPESPGWALRPEVARQPDGRVVTAVHSDEKAIVRVFASPAWQGEKLDDVFNARKKQVAAIFGVTDIDKVIAKVLHDEQREVGGRIFRQWQAVTQPSAGPDEKPATIILMWLMTLDTKRSLECIGLVRAPVKQSPEEQKGTDALLRDVAYILESVQVR